MCSVFKIFKSKTEGTKCSGQLTRLGDLTNSVDSYLAKHNCLRNRKLYSCSDLILNRLICDSIDTKIMAQVDICEGHKDLFSVKHKSIRQTTCSWEGCHKSGQLGKPRVSFEDSARLSNQHSQFIPVGSILCHLHRPFISSREKFYLHFTLYKNFFI